MNCSLSSRFKYTYNYHVTMWFLWKIHGTINETLLTWSFIFVIYVKPQVQNFTEYLEFQGLFLFMNSSQYYFPLIIYRSVFELYCDYGFEWNFVFFIIFSFFKNLPVVKAACFKISIYFLFLKCFQVFKKLEINFL